MLPVTVTTHPRKTPLRGGEDAVNAVMPFLIALGLFAVAFGGVLAFTNNHAGGNETGTEAKQRLTAEGIADLLVSSPGVGWEGGPDGVQRVGLQRPDGRGIDLERMEALRRGGDLLADPTNGKLDYEEALLGLGLSNDGTVGFHVRVRAAGAAFVDDFDPASVRAAYVGDWPDLPSVLVGLGTEEEMAAQARAEYESLLASLVREERSRLAAVGLDFDDRIHLGVLPDAQVGVLGWGVSISVLVQPTLLDGDVYPDSSEYLRRVMVPRLSEYDLVVVGSGVDHSALSGNAFKAAVADWVVDGGTLVVLGSGQQDDPWLKPLYQQATPTINQQQVVPDIQNLVLSEPHDLDWTRYDDHGKGWNLDQGGEPSPQHFVRVVINAGRDVLAISGDGVYGDGLLVLTSFRPGAISAEDPRQAEWFFDNLVHYSFGRDVRLDFGPTPPKGVSIGLAVRLSQAWDDRAGLVPVEVQVLVWGRP